MSIPATSRDTARPTGLVVMVVATLALLATSASLARAAETDLYSIAIELETVASGFDAPVLVTHADDGSGDLYVVEQEGRIRVIEPGGDVPAEPFLDLSSAVVTGGERGLLGLAFHPDYASNGRFFVDYTRTGDGATVISELTAADGVADPSSERELLVLEQPFANNNGGMIAFDAAGYLLVGTGDGGAGGDPLGSGQDPGSLLGKLLRLDVDATGDGAPYGIPDDNGFADTDAYRPEIHAIGLRNPWRFSVDPVGGHVYIGDVGQERWEEVDVLPGGVGGTNFGWNEVEGPECFSSGCDLDSYTGPVISYGRGSGCAVIGGYVYRGAAQPALDGVYLFGDLCSGRIWGASAAEMLTGPASATELGRLDGNLVSFGMDEAGEIYAVELGGRILHVVATGAE